jgi:hypothetical protein
MVIETAGSNEAHDAAKLDAFLEEASGSGAVQDGLIAQSSAQAAAVWRVREGCALGLLGPAAGASCSPAPGGRGGMGQRVLHELACHCRCRCRCRWC